MIKEDKVKIKDKTEQIDKLFVDMNERKKQIIIDEDERVNDFLRIY